jgi:hypothetical protein
VLLFGPTDPNVWAPRNKNVQVLSAPNGRLGDLKIEEVQTAIATLRSRLGIFDAISRRSR